MTSGPIMRQMRVGVDDSSLTRQKIKPGTARRVLPYAKQFRGPLAFMMLFTGVDASIAAVTPLILKVIIDNGIQQRQLSVVVVLTAVLAGLAVTDAFAVYLQTLTSGRIGQGLIYDLRTRVFRHVQQQPIAFFTRTQTGSLISRLNSDIVGAQQVVTSVLTQAVSVVLTMVLVLSAMLYLSWQITVAALILVPLFLIPGKLVGRRTQRLTRESMQQNAVMATMMNERFNVAGAMLTKLYGRPDDDGAEFDRRAARLRDIVVSQGVWGRILAIISGLLAALTAALVYGFGGALAIDGRLQIGTLVAMVALLMRLYGPINQLSNIQLSIVSAMVSFDRIFEVLDLKPQVAERANAYAYPVERGAGATAPDIEFDRVAFRYPQAAEVSLASLESTALPSPERTDDTWVLQDVSFLAPAGKLTALVGPSGAGKTTITHLVPRLYDPQAGRVCIGGHDVRDLTMKSLHDMVGVVTQDAHMFHDTIRANLLFARPDATEGDLVEACMAAQIWEVVSALPDGLDTVVGDRGYRFSGGEKQRLALARLLLKAPPIVVLDEATAHLDSESEAAIQRALETALAGRTSLVIAHRLSTIRHADQILVVNQCRIQERGTHDSLLAEGGLYAVLYRTQFARQANGRSASPRTAVRPGPRLPGSP